MNQLTKLINISDPASKRCRTCRQDHGLRGQDRRPRGQAPARNGETTGEGGKGIRDRVRLLRGGSRLGVDSLAQTKNFRLSIHKP